MTSTIKPLTYGEDRCSDGGGSEMYIEEVDNPGTQVAYVLNYGDFNKTLALAKLFAAAPDMLEALRMVLDDPEALDGRPRTYECVRSAIAKVRGEK